MENLIYDEQEEIDRILRALTNWMRPHEDILANYQRYATEIDVICAKSLYAQQINGVMPKLNDTTDLDLTKPIIPYSICQTKKRNKPPTHRRFI